MANIGYESYEEAVSASGEIEPTPTIDALARNAGIPAASIVHHILVQWATSYAEAHLSMGPLAIRQLRAAADEGDLVTVKGIIGWLESEG